jgi:hypothetical protein
MPGWQGWKRERMRSRRHRTTDPCRALSGHRRRSGIWSACTASWRRRTAVLRGAQFDRSGKVSGYWRGTRRSVGLWRSYRPNFANGLSRSAAAAMSRSIDTTAPLSRSSASGTRKRPATEPLAPYTHMDFEGRVSRNSGNPSGMTHRTRLLVHVLSLGGTTSGSSRLPVVTSISSGKSELSKVSWAPQRGQNDRVPVSLDLNRVGMPLTRRNSPRRTLNHVTIGAPVVRRQIEQWQVVS